jgi:hypothetical protein
MTFTNGLVKESTWIDGTFNSGLFYDSNTFNGSTSSNYNENLIHIIRVVFYRITDTLGKVVSFKW